MLTLDRLFRRTDARNPVHVQIFVRFDTQLVPAARREDYSIKEEVNSLLPRSIANKLDLEWHRNIYVI